MMKRPRVVKPFQQAGKTTLGSIRAGLAAALVAAAFLASGQAQTVPSAVFSTTEAVGPSGAHRIVTPANQIVTPAGDQIDLPKLRPQALAISPDGRILVTSGKTAELIVVSVASGKIVARVPLPSDKATEPLLDAVSTRILEPDKDGQLSFTGLLFSPEGDRIYLSNVNRSVKVFRVERKPSPAKSAGSTSGGSRQELPSFGYKVTPSHSIPLPETGLAKRKKDIPAGLAISRDGKRLYVVLNMSNQLVELDAASGNVLRTFAVGVAPYDVVLVGKKAYVSNWGGRRPGAGSLTGPAGHGTRVRVDPVRHIANEGSVSVIDLGANRVLDEIIVGLHSSAMARSPSGRHVVVANAASDTLSVIDTRTDKVVETIWTRPSPADLFGASPTALTFDAAGHTLFVCNGTHNAVAVISFRPGESKLTGLIPTGWFPGAIVHDPQRRALYVANIKGIGPGKKDDKTGKISSNSHQYFGTLSLMPVPGQKALAAHTRMVLRNYRAPALEAARLLPRPGQPARPVPERTGEPSLFKHVVYIIKENRTYDQVLGDMKEGNGEPSLCIFGEQVTPNQHKLSREFVLLDNTYCSGILSADGHQWADTAFATDYMERSFAGFPRSYPDGMDDGGIDAIAYSPGGFIWDNALAHGRTLRDYGEFAITEGSWKDKANKKAPKFLDYYRDFVNQTGLINISSRPAIESLRPHLCTNTVGWEMEIPDAFRASQFIKELNQFEQSGELPNLIIICLPDDHTSGTAAGAPTPAAQVADNDLAFGRILEALSHSRFWKETCVFSIEDDPQAGWDHVSGYRTTAYVVSPYTKRKQTVSTQYNQTSLLRTIELILGLPPMNIMDASATPMFDCFTDQPDFTPFVALPNNIPLDQMNPDPKKVSDRLLRRQAYASARLPLDKPDQCPEDLLNRILWHAMKGSDAPYPVWATTAHTDDD